MRPVRDNSRMYTRDGEQPVPDRWTKATVRPDLWLDAEDDPRQAGPELGDERAVLLEYLRVARLTLQLKCDGLDVEQMARRSVPPSTMSLLGMVRHMAEVERHWFRRFLADHDVPRIYGDGERDADWTGAVADAGVVADAWVRWQEECAFADAYLGSEPDLGASTRDGHGTAVSVREVLVHMIEEYSRHNGHADLLRERIDGRVGQ